MWASSESRQWSRRSGDQIDAGVRKKGYEVLGERHRRPERGSSAFGKRAPIRTRWSSSCDEADHRRVAGGLGARVAAFLRRRRKRSSEFLAELP
jgi:hypothetical protein